MKQSDDEVKAAVRLLAQWGHNQREISLAIGIQRSDINRLYPVQYAEGKLHIQKKLRKAQLDKAYEGNVNMLIHLGKYYLGQNESALADELLVEDVALDKASTAELLSIVKKMT